MAVHPMPVDPDVGIPDLIHRLTDDSRRLVGNEVRLAKIELRESVQRGGKGAMLLGLAFGAAAVATVMLTLFLTTIIGRVASGHMWIGAILTGIGELGVGAWLVKRGISVAANARERGSES